MNKFGRNYELNIQTQRSTTLTVALPFTIEFDITRNVLSSANTSSIRVYNLSQNNRNQVRKNVTDYGDLRLISLRAGYGSNLPIIFSGNISHAWNVRESNNFITQVDSFDGGFAFANGFTQESFPSETPQQTVVETLLNNLDQQGVSFGAVGNIQGVLSRGNSYSGPTTSLLKELSGGGFFIDNQKSYVLSDNEALPARGISVINAQSGLLGTPILEQTILHFDMIFEPRLIIGQVIKLDSLNPVVPNGDYKVVSLKHRGMISDAVCGDAITSVGLFSPLSGTGLSIVGSV